jgi:hypothetical protein
LEHWDFFYKGNSPGKNAVNGNPSLSVYTGRREKEQGLNDSHYSVPVRLLKTSKKHTNVKV